MKLIAPSILSADFTRLQDEIKALRKKLPKVPERPKKLDPWLRLHLAAHRRVRHACRAPREHLDDPAVLPRDRRLHGGVMDGKLAKVAIMMAMDEDEAFAKALDGASSLTISESEDGTVTLEAGDESIEIGAEDLMAEMEGEGRPSSIPAPPPPTTRT